MAAKKGDGILLVFSDVAPEHDEEFNRWYNKEHLPERLSIPGVLNAARYEAVKAAPSIWPATNWRHQTPGILTAGRNG